MDTPQRTPIETQLARFRTVRLAGAAAIVAVMAIAGNKCDSCVENALKDGGATVSDASTNDNETGADGGDEKEISADKGSDTDSMDTPTDGEKTSERELSDVLDQDAIDKTVRENIWTKMNTLAEALLRKYPPLPEFVESDGGSACSGQTKSLGIERTQYDPRGPQMMHISTGVRGCSNAVLTVMYLPKLNGHELNGQLKLDLQANAFDNESADVLASENDIEIVTGFFDIADRYNEELGKLDPAADDYPARRDALRAEYRALVTRYLGQVAPNVDAE